MSAMGHNIKISKQTKDKLDQIKKSGGHTSYDSVIRELMTIRIMMTRKMKEK